MFQKVLILLIIAIFLCGCFMPVRNVPIEKYYVNVEYQGLSGNATGLTVGIRDVEYPRTITRFVTVLEDEGKIEFDENREWAEHPGEIMKKLLMDTFIMSGRFRDVADVMEMKKPDLVLYSELQKFYVVKDGNATFFEVFVSIRLREPKMGQLVWSGSFTKRNSIDNLYNKLSLVASKTLSEISSEILKSLHSYEFNKIIGEKE